MTAGATSVAGTAAAPGLPADYERFRAGGADVVALSAAAAAVREALGDAPDGTLYGYAQRHPRARALAGRGTAWAVPLPDERTHVVVRRSRHGGLFAGLTGDRFLAPTRAPHELRTAVRLADAGVRTPQVVAFAVYPAGPLLRRSDVATREVMRGRDLAVALLNPTDAPGKHALLAATAKLLAALARAGARHPDLNCKNVLLAPGGSGVQAWVLDVDRVEFGRPGDPRIARANLERLCRSARKWRDVYGASVDETDLAWLAGAAAAS